MEEDGRSVATRVYYTQSQPAAPTGSFYSWADISEATLCTDRS